MKYLAALLFACVMATSAGAQSATRASDAFDEQFADLADREQPQEAATGEATEVEARNLRDVVRAPRNAALVALPSAHQTASAVTSTASKPSVAPLARETGTSDVVRIVLVLSLMAFLPALVISMTSFVRIVVVLSMIRHGFGMPETPPNQVLISLAIFFTAFSMMPTLEQVNGQALQPFLSGQIDVQQAIDKGSGPMRTFMLRQVRDQDIKAVYDMSRTPLPARAQDVALTRLVPAFMLNELRVAFRIGFVILLPFLLIDLVVSSILLALGMMMVPPSTLSLPLKVLMFVLIDGWSLVLQGVVGSIH